MAINGLLFDLDNTLYNRELAFESWALAFIEDVLEIKDLAEREALLTWMIAEDADGYGSKQAIFEKLRLRFPNQIGESSNAVDRLFDNFMDHVVLDSDTTSLLDKLDAAAFPYGIVTNGSIRQQRKLERLGLDHRTSCVFISDVFGKAKPEADIFLAAADRPMGLPVAEVLFVGDNPVNDILGAAQVGMQTAWLQHGHTWPYLVDATMPDHVIDSVADVAAIIWPM